MIGANYRTNLLIVEKTELSAHCLWNRNPYGVDLNVFLVVSQLYDSKVFKVKNIFFRIFVK